MEDHRDYNVRQWVLDSSINSNKKGAPTEKILDDARKYYGFLFPNNCHGKKPLSIVVDNGGKKD